MIIRPATIVWVVLLMAAAFGLYMVKFKVQAVKVEVAATEKHLREEKQNLHVLKAEWTYLTRPERLRELSAKYLPLKPMNGQQLADFGSLPVTASTNAVQPASDDEEGSPEAPSVTLVSGATHAR